MGFSASRYCLVVGVLPHDSLRRAADIVETPTPENPYTVIKQQLLGVHQMTDYQRAEKLYLSLPIGDRKPSDALWTLHEQLAAVAAMPVATDPYSFVEDNGVGSPVSGGRQPWSLRQSWPQ
jgi:hypothetical protein